MLFSESCSKGLLQLNGTIVQVVSPLQRVVWSVQRREITYIGVKKGRMMMDLTIYTSTNHYPANFMAPQNAQKFLALFPGIPTGEPVAVQPQPYAPPLAQHPQWNAEPTMPFQAPAPVPPPPAKRKLPRWAFIAIGALALVLCTCTSFGVIAAVTSNNGQQAHVVATATATPASTAQSSTLAATVAADTPTAAPTQAPTPTLAPTAKPTPRPTTPPPPPPTPKPQPTSPPTCQGVNGNPWCYDFNPGSYIYVPPSGFCNYFNCIASFYGSDDPGDGYIIECQDATYSQSGGERGACSSHGGELRPLYAH